MRKAMFWLGWTIFILLPVAVFTEIALIQDVPTMQPWKWAVPIVAFTLIALGRNRDDVLKHHLT